jgi:hypothetical protein
VDILKNRAVLETTLVSVKVQLPFVPATLARLSQLERVVTRMSLQIRAAMQKVRTKVILRPVVLSG